MDLPNSRKFKQLTPRIENLNNTPYNYHFQIKLAKQSSNNKNSSFYTSRPLVQLTPITKNRVISPPNEEIQNLLIENKPNFKFKIQINPMNIYSKKKIKEPEKYHNISFLVGKTKEKFFSRNNYYQKMENNRVNNYLIHARNEAFKKIAKNAKENRNLLEKYYPRNIK